MFAEKGRIIGNVIYGLTVTTYFGLNRYPIDTSQDVES